MDSTKPSQRAVLGIFPVYDDPLGATTEALLQQICCNGHIEDISESNIPSLAEHFTQRLSMVSVVAIRDGPHYEQWRSNLAAGRASPPFERWLSEERASMELRELGLKLVEPRTFLCFAAQYLRHPSIRLSLRAAIGSWDANAPGFVAEIFDIGTFAAPTGKSEKTHALFFCQDSGTTHLFFDQRGMLDRWFVLAVPQ